MNRITLALAFSLALTASACSRAAEPTPTPPPSASPPAATPSAVAPSATSSAAPTPADLAGVRNATYLVEGQPVTLKDGLAEVPAAPGSASKVTTRFFGNEAVGDLNGDGQADVAFVLTRDSGGSGTFFYAVAAVRTAAGWTGTNAVLLGDRIAPQSTRYDSGRVVFTYAERQPGEPMTAQPSVGVSKAFAVEEGRLTERR